MSMHKKERNRGLVFIEMASPEEAATALKSLESFVSEITIVFSFFFPPN